MVECGVVTFSHEIQTFLCSRCPKYIGGVGVRHVSSDTYYHG